MRCTVLPLVLQVLIKRENAMKLGRIRAEMVAVGAAAFILAYVLMLRPVIGVADNGDFGRIIGSAGLQYLAEGQDRYFGYVSREYRVTPLIPFAGGYFSTELFFVWLAVRVSQTFTGSGIFDIRFLAALYSVALLGAIYLLVRYGRQVRGASGWLLGALLIFLFADIGYISYFNSFYGEALTVVSLLLMAGGGLALAAREKPELWALLVFFGGAVCLSGAKVQNSPVGILAILYGLRLLKVRWGDKTWRKAIYISTALILAVSALSYLTISRDIKVCNKYQTVFYGVLKDSPHPEEDLKELGLDPGLAVLAGTNYFMKEYPVDIRNPAFKAEIFEKVNHFKIAAYYLRHPDRLMQKLEVAAREGFKLKQGFGNYEKYPGISYKQTANLFGVWSDFKMQVLPHTFPFVGGFFLIYLVVLALSCRRQREPGGRLRVELLALIAVTGMMQFLLPFVGDGEADISKHLFLFNGCFDLMVVSGAVWAAGQVLNLGRAVRARLAAANG